jgi:hypothetical protein
MLLRGRFLDAACFVGFTGTLSRVGHQTFVLERAGYGKRPAKGINRAIRLDPENSGRMDPSLHVPRQVGNLTEGLGNHNVMLSKLC